jgi:hypothetical protein
MNRLLHELADGAFVVLILLVCGLLFSVRQLPGWWHRLRSAHWPTAPGTIESGEVSTIRSRSRYWDRGIETATAQLAYSYRLGGDYFAGYHIETFNDEQKAWSYVDGLKGQPVVVSYNPKKPDVSVLRRPPAITIEP